MKRLVLSLLLSTALFAVSAHASDVLSSPAPVQECAGVPAADYVPGVDVEGRPVASADLTPSVIPELATITVFPEIEAPDNPYLDGTQVAVNLWGLDQAMNPPPCAGLAPHVPPHAPPDAPPPGR